MRITGLVFALLVTACGRAKPEPGPSPPTESEIVTYNDVEIRLPEFVQGGFVHSLAAGVPTAQGDGLFNTGLGVYGADCTAGAPLAQGLEDMLKTTGGAVYRDPTLPTQSILDGALMLYRAVTKRVNRCGEKARWAPLIADHVAYMGAHGGALNVDGSKLPAGFDYVRDLVAYKLGVGSEPSYARQQILEDLVVTTWTVADIAAHAACYRAHLALVSLQVIEENSGVVTATARNGYCAATVGVGMLTADHWCGRLDLKASLDAFKYDVWEYRPQRCSTTWETPDGNGQRRPGIDYLVEYEDEAKGLGLTAL